MCRVHLPVRQVSIHRPAKRLIWLYVFTLTQPSVTEPRMLASVSLSPLYPLPAAQREQWGAAAAQTGGGWC